MALKYKEGDRVRIKSLDWYNRQKNETEVKWKYYSFSCHMTKYCGQIMTISIVGGYSYSMIEDDGVYSWTDEMIEGLVEEENINNKWTGLKVELELSKTVIGVSNVESLRGERFMSGFVKAIIPPEGYIFKDENGNVINAMKIVLEKKKKEYPKTYEECCNVLNTTPQERCQFDFEPYGEELYYLHRLLVCRDAYWKIAGEEIGLGKPWEPDWKNEDNKFIIQTYDNEVGCWSIVNTHRIFAFPTPEMRDVFKENFDPNIKICKEFL